MYNPQIELILIWNPNTNQLEKYNNVFVQVVGNNGTVYQEEGPITITSFSQVHEAIKELKERIGMKLYDQEKENMKMSGMFDDEY